jgi:chemotaxis protein MotB
VRRTPILEILLSASFTAFFALGCVTQGSYDELQTERDAMQATNARLEEELGSLRDQNASLSERLGVAETSLARAELKMQSLTGTYDQLVTELQQEVDAGQVEIRKVAEGISLNVSEELLFGSGQVELNESGRALLKRVAERLQSEASSVWVEGHTDDVRVGPKLKARYPTNWELAAARATNAVHVLADSGVEPSRLRAVSRGPFDPVAPNDTPEGRQKNRRTEIILRPIPQ